MLDLISAKWNYPTLTLGNRTSINSVVVGLHRPSIRFAMQLSPHGTDPFVFSLAIPRTGLLVADRLPLYSNYEDPLTLG